MEDVEKVQFKFMIPARLKAELEELAYKNRRSLSAEIVARLESAVQGNLPDISAEGFAALIKQMEAVVSGGFGLLFDIRDTLPGLETFMLENDLERHEAVRRILSEWLAGAGYVVPTSVIADSEK